ncbi:hypothetical protein EV1_004524 [Malus domestica]
MENIRKDNFSYLSSLHLPRRNPEENLGPMPKQRKRLQQRMQKIETERPFDRDSAGIVAGPAGIEECFLSLCREIFMS